jgi:hypothetical protein
MDCFERYFDDAMRIYAICGDEALSDDEARLLTYMHAKGCESGKGVDYFADPSEYDDTALEIMIGETILTEQAVTPAGDVVTIADPFTATIGERIRSLDESLKEEHGFENRFCGELHRRMRLYRDPEFRTRMMDVYKEKIAPKIFGYSQEKLQGAFERYRAKRVDDEREIGRMLDR